MLNLERLSVFLLFGVCEKEEDGLKITHEEFLDRAKKVHGDKYDYTHDQYRGMHEEYKILCKSHGFFNLKPVFHTHTAQGCRECLLEGKYKEAVAKMQDFIDGKYPMRYKVKDFDGDVIYCVCKDHGDYTCTNHSFKKTPYVGCRGCKSRQEAKIFIKKASKLHKGKYAYKEADYVCSRTLMPIWCNKHKEFFEQRPSAHLQGQNCPECGREGSSSSMRKDSEVFISQLNSLYPNKFETKDVDYQGHKKPVTVYCDVHGRIDKKPNQLLASGCVYCNRKEKAKQYSEKFINEVNTNKLLSHVDASEVTYINNRTKVKLRCKLHDKYFYATPNKVLDESRFSRIGCEDCRKLRSNRWTIKSVKSIPFVSEMEGFVYIGCINKLKGYKIGFTKDLDTRFSIYKSDMRNTDLTFNYLYTFKTNLVTASVIETLLKKIFKDYHVKHNLEFGGKSEIYDLPCLGLVVDLFSGRYDLEINYLADQVNSPRDKAFKDFVKMLKREYGI